MRFINELKNYESGFNLVKYEEVIYLQIPAVFLHSSDSVSKLELA
jgi:hypothetical protein